MIYLWARKVKHPHQMENNCPPNCVHCERDKAEELEEKVVEEENDDQEEDQEPPIKVPDL